MLTQKPPVLLFNLYLHHRLFKAKSDKPTATDVLPCSSEHVSSLPHANASLPADAVMPLWLSSAAAAAARPSLSA